MKRRTQTILFHLLPAVFWLLAIGGSVVPVFFLPDYAWGFIPAVLALLSVFLIGRIKRHTSSVEQCFQMAVLLGIAAYWLPTVVFLIVPIWGYLVYQNLFTMRSFLATLLGVATVAAWFAVLSFLLPETFHLSPFTFHLYRWIPTGALLIAYIASTIVRQTLRVR